MKGVVARNDSAGALKINSHLRVRGEDASPVGHTLLVSIFEFKLWKGCAKLHLCFALLGSHLSGSLPLHDVGFVGGFLGYCIDFKPLGE
jgi:hypothetical protein